MEQIPQSKLVQGKRREKIQTRDSLAGSLIPSYADPPQLPPCKFLLFTLEKKCEIPKTYILTFKVHTLRVSVQASRYQGLD